MLTLFSGIALFFRLAYEDAKYEHVSLFGLIGFIFLAGCYCFMHHHRVSLFYGVMVVLFLLFMCYFCYQKMLGIGDVLAAIGCFFIVMDQFFLMMCIAFTLCALSLVAQKKKRTGFIPYLWSSLILVQMYGVLC